ncbi:MBL fold metallo-hydrolase [Ostreiculturibacter nitratireducens]|uniref:MBL fold metallo-hydrolase n=1 Tax=Ostreiculturibacter nitratireducens TaxID=3075226 RepID=UPI0031B5EE58
MKIRLLCENSACGLVWQAEWGFSALIEHGGENILFDTGYSDVWLRNSDIAGIDLDDVDVIALSHFHDDHTRGLLSHRFKERKRVVCHPRVLTESYDSDDPGAMQDYRDIRAKLASDFEVETTRAPLELAPGAFFLGEIPRVTPFERGTCFDDPMEDDTALAFRTDKGAVVVSGCSHAGICNIAIRAKEVTGQHLHAVIGGFHMMKAEDPPIDETIDWFMQEKVERLLPMHCVEFEYLVKFHAAFAMPTVGAGDLIEI